MRYGTATTNMDIERLTVDGGPKVNGKFNKRKRPNLMIVSKEISEKYLTDGDLTPIDVMMLNMRYYAREAVGVMSVAKEMLARMEAMPVNPNDRDACDKQREIMSEIVNLMHKAFGMRDHAQECAVDCAPYMHPRLASITLKPELPKPELSRDSIPDDPVEASRVYQQIIIGAIEHATEMAE